MRDQFGAFWEYRIGLGGECEGVYGFSAALDVFLGIEGRYGALVRRCWEGVGGET